HRAEIVDAAIFHHVDQAGLRIDLDLGDVTAVWKGRSARAVADVRDVERLRRVLRKLRAVLQQSRKLEQRYGAVRAADDEAAIGELDVGRGRFEDVARDLLALLDDLGGGLDDRGAAVDQRFRPAAA